MITPLPALQLSIIGNLFMAIDGVVGGMQDADVLLSAGVSRRESPRPGPDHSKPHHRCRWPRPSGLGKIDPSRAVESDVRPSGRMWGAAGSSQ
jgi:hypothetical protein